MLKHVYTRNAPPTHEPAKPMKTRGLLRQRLLPHLSLCLAACALLFACGGSDSEPSSSAAGGASATTSSGSSDGGSSTSSSQGGSTASAGGMTSGQGGSTGGKLGDVVGTYFVEWSVYGRDYHVADMPADKLTHILYGFIPICGPNDSLNAANPSGYATLQKECQGKPDYSVTIFDRFAALEKAYPGDSPQSPYKGNFGQLAKLKESNPNLKILPSLGGWTLSDPFYSLAASAAHRKTFIDSTIAFLKTYTFFDGIDVDWEYPGGGGASATLGSAADAANYTTLMKELREALDKLGSENSRSYLLTTAVGCGPPQIAAVDYMTAAQHLDYIFAMTYDFYGAWSNVLGHHTALHPSENNSTNEGYNTSSAITKLLSAGVPANKLVLGVAMYGRGWKGVQSNDPSPFAGMGQGAIAGSWEPGIIDYKHIVEKYAGPSGQGIGGFSYSYDTKAEAPFLYNASTGELITYDDKRSTKAKRDYAAGLGLAGLFSWEIDADNGDILAAMNGE